MPVGPLGPRRDDIMDRSPDGWDENDDRELAEERAMADERGTTDERGMTAHFTDAEIQAVVEHYDDPEHPDALSVPEVRELLAALQERIEGTWSDHVDAIREGALEVARDTGETIVLRDAKRRWWDRLLDDLEVYDQVDRTIVRVTHHQAARRLVDADGSVDLEGSDPVVVHKPADAEAGQQLVEAVIESLLRRGVPEDEAWAYYCVDVRGLSGRVVAERCGFDDRLSVADAVETARARLEE